MVARLKVAAHIKPQQIMRDSEPGKIRGVPRESLTMVFANDVRLICREGSFCLLNSLVSAADLPKWDSKIHFNRCVLVVSHVIFHELDSVVSQFMVIGLFPLHQEDK